MSDTSELRALAKRLGNPLAVDDTAPAIDSRAMPRRDRATADDRQSARASLDRKLRAAKAAEQGDNES